MNRAEVQTSLERVLAWVEAHDYQGWEYYDGLSSFLRPLTFGSQFGERVLVQLVRRCPFNLRPWIGIEPKHSTKGMAFFARTYLRLWQVTKANAYQRKARFCLDWLEKNPSPGNYSGLCWGNHFDHAARPFRLPKFAPTIVWVSFIGQAFLDAYEQLNEPRYLDAARSIGQFVLRDLPREQTPTGDCLSYVTFKQVSIHNSNMLGAGFLAWLASITGDTEAQDAARSAIAYSCARQLEDGAWYYGEAPTYRWIDNWHTAYNLDALRLYMDRSGDHAYAGALDRGYRFFKEHFFLEDGCPKYYHDRPDVADIQAAAQAIDTFAYFSDLDPGALACAQRVARWTVENMQDPSGYFYYRVAGGRKIRIPFLHWGQATMASGLSHLLVKMS